jgi:hypothetical protein
MLSEAKHLDLFSLGNRLKSDQRLKAWPRGLCPLRCSFAFAQNDIWEMGKVFFLRDSCASLVTPN